MTERSTSKRTSGWLWIWSSNIGGYEKMWFVLSEGILAHYTNQEEMKDTCQGQISIAGSIIDFDETCKFVICQYGEANHVKADDQEDKQRWIEALTAARDVASDVNRRSLNSTDASTEIECKNEFTASQSRPLMISTKVSHHAEEGKLRSEESSSTARHTSSDDERESQDSNDACTEHNLHDQDGHLHQCAEDLAIIIDAGPAEKMESHNSNITDNTIQGDNYRDTRQSATVIKAMKQKLKDVQTCNELISKCNLDLQRSIAATKNCQENEKFQAASHHAAEYQVTASAMTSACTDYTNLAESHNKQWITLYQSEHQQRVKLEQVVKSLTQTISEDDESFEYFDCYEAAHATEISNVDVALHVYQAVGGPSENRSRRTRIPDRPNVSDSLWSVLKNCIGSDLSKMPLPVSFAEPLSLLQRLTEDFEYAHVLDRASEFTDAAIQFAYVVAFISSSYSTTVGRSGKPFNPLLGETYECDRQSDLGWKSIAEQVSHHPPVAAIYAEGKNWEFWMDQSMKSKFKGTTLTVVPLGECHLNFRNGNRYSWKKPNTSIHNVIVGKLWVEQEGDVDIKCATSNITSKLTFSGSGWTGETYSLKGVIKDGNGKAIFDIVGKYSSQIEYRPAGSKDPGTIVWKRTEPAADHAKYYHFTVLACQLNEMEDGVAPTDSRLRPDQRLMEEGKFDAANLMKKKLEDFQRANKAETWTPSWFKRQTDPDTNTEMWTYGGEYWPCKAKKDWSRCPSHIFSPP